MSTDRQLAVVFSVAMQNQQNLHLLSVFMLTKGSSVCVCTDRPEIYPPSLKPTTDSMQRFGARCREKACFCSLRCFTSRQMRELQQNNEGQHGRERVQGRGIGAMKQRETVKEAFRQESSLKN